MTSTDRRAREQAAVRDKILGAARDLFVREGYEAVSMRKIAEAIEYSPPAIYTHFTDKAELMKELCRRDFHALAEHFNKLGKIDDPVQRIYRIGLTYIRFAVENPNHYRLMFMSDHHKDGPTPDEEDLKKMGNPEHDAYAFLGQAVRQALAAGSFRADLKDAELITQVLWSAVHGVASLQITHAEDPWITWRSLDKRARLIADSVLRGMLSDDAAARLNAGSGSGPGKEQP